MLFVVRTSNVPRMIILIYYHTSGVVLEEMLHLSLAGNTLLAVGGTPKLYDPKIISAYPTPMPGRTPELILHLRKMTNENLQTYIDVRIYHTIIIIILTISTAARIAGVRTRCTSRAR